MNLKLVIEYDGTDFCGWQLQPGQRSVQGEMENAIAALTGQTVRLHGAGRTDSGVHALAQVANCQLETKIPPGRFAAALNPLLPSDVKVLSAEAVSDSWHARFSAQGKVYVYRLLLSPSPRPLARHRAYRLPPNLDLDAIERALPLFVGRHDFRAFAAKGSSALTTERTITRAELTRRGEQCDLVFSGDGFLYHMVRIIVGDLVSVALGKLTIQDIASALATGYRSRPPVTAPAQGLYLVEVIYDDEPLC
ncbi:MAG: tRNA pseudouridine(38-40) synthase TruA [Firmicutes bacterium]|nr:tRNA pseudouridine(38-40) synthase TruA [Dethiobacter sp.]MBS3888284.1 tRNA pseudouridine(38-40) synthase TruA [Bacillota bacterium]